MEKKEEKTLADIRNEYCSQELLENSVSQDPFQQFKAWIDEAIKSKTCEPTAMNLSTVSGNGRPSSRIVLLKGFSHDGFTFYTNYRSKKAKELNDNKYAAITFFWPELERQIRIEGKVTKVSRDESKNYFLSRPRGSQVGAWVSPQSQEISKEELEQRLSQKIKEWDGKEVDCPDFWGGYIIQPDYFEFWQGRPSRLHDRITYVKEVDNWSIKRIAP